MLLLLYEEQRQPSSVQLLQILTHTLVVARQLYDFQLPVTLPRLVLTLQAPFMLVLEQALNSAAEAETARTARTAVSFIVLGSKAL